MSWGQQPQQQYGGYGAPGASAPPPSYGGAPAGYQQQRFPPAYGQQAQYGQPPPQQYGGYGQAPGQHPPPQQHAPPPQQHTLPHQQHQPQGYGAPMQGYPGAPPPQALYSAAPPPPGISPDLWQWFQAVDQDRSGKITAIELQQALMNGNWSPFNAETCRIMIGMFDRDRNGTIDVHEFSALWKYIQDWKGCFDRFDLDRSGNIDANELSNAFATFGYRLSPQFSHLVVRTFDRKGGRNIKFDDFIQACVMLKTLTDKFRAHDQEQRGMIRISYEQFLEMVLDNTLMNVK